MPPKHYKNEESSEKLGPVVNTTLGPVFNTKKNPNLGPILLSSIYIYIYIQKRPLCIYIYIYHLSLSIFLSLYIYICCEVILWAKFGHFRCYYLGQVGVIIWAKLFLAYKIVVSSDFWHTHTVIICVFFCAQLSGSYLKLPFSKKGCKNWVIQISVF